MKRLYFALAVFSDAPQPARRLGTQVPVAPPRPNIVFILVDNLGYGELGVYGGGILRGAPTRRIDKLAGEGTRLLNFNVEAQCTPTRSALMTITAQDRFWMPSTTQALRTTPSSSSPVTTGRRRPTHGRATAVRGAVRTSPRWKLLCALHSSFAGRKDPCRSSLQ